jgi:uncharacterized damage-inducible protein DinB
MSVGVDYVRMMAAYNAEMNRRLYDAAARLDDGARRVPRGAFWGSIHGTLAHLVWGDQQWMSRFDGWPKNTVAMRGSGVDERPFEALRETRVVIDAGILEWAGRIEQSWLAGELTWFSGAAGRELSKPLGVLVVHFFNHQTHHRGQVHAMLTAAGEQTGDTDLMLIA